MNKDQFQGQWKSIKGKIKEKWGKLTDDDLTQINGKREQLVGQLQKKYGYAKEKAEEELKNWKPNSTAILKQHKKQEEPMSSMIRIETTANFVS